MSGAPSSPHLQKGTQTWSSSAMMNSIPPGYPVWRCGSPMSPSFVPFAPVAAPGGVGQVVQLPVHAMPQHSAGVTSAATAIAPVPATASSPTVRPVAFTSMYSMGHNIPHPLVAMPSSSGAGSFSALPAMAAPVPPLPLTPQAAAAAAQLAGQKRSAAHRADVSAPPKRARAPSGSSARTADALSAEQVLREFDQSLHDRARRPSSPLTPSHVAQIHPQYLVQLSGFVPGQASPLSASAAEAPPKATRRRRAASGAGGRSASSARSRARPAPGRPSALYARTLLEKYQDRLRSEPKPITTRGSNFKLEFSTGERVNVSILRHVGKNGERADAPGVFYWQALSNVHRQRWCGWATREEAAHIVRLLVLEPDFKLPGQ